MTHQAPEPSISDTIRNARMSFADKFTTVPLANSLDGRTFTFQGPVSLFLNPGDYARITAQDGGIYIGQVFSSQIREFDGPEVRIQDAENKALSKAGISVHGTSISMQMTSLRGSGILLQRTGVSHGTKGFNEARIEAASVEEVRSVQAAWARKRPTLTVGERRLSEGSVPALISAGGFNRHTFMCGQSGSGKTYSLGVVLEQILMYTDLRVAILDPNADYVRLNIPRSNGSSAALNSEKAQLVEKFESRISELKVFRSTVEDEAHDLPLRISMNDLSKEDQAKVMMLDPLADRDEYDAFARVADRLDGQPYTLEDIRKAAMEDLSEVSRKLLLRASNLGVGEWGIWAQNDERSLTDYLAEPWRSVVLDVSHFERSIERSVMALAILRHVWERRTDRKPVLLVIDEAHNVCPKEPSDPIQNAATELLIAMAGEGRKYGIYLLLSTQRPDKIHPNVISQCDNLMIMRLNSRSDLAQLQQVFSFVPPDILSEAVAFQQGEALFAGSLVQSPMLTRVGQRISEEGGADVKTSWTTVSNK